MTFEYADAPESTAVVNLHKNYDLFINGEFVAGKGKSFDTINPATEEKLATVKAARAAFKKWSALKGSERGKYLFRIARIIQDRSRELAVLESMDNGKPIRETRDVDIPLVAAHFFHYAGWAERHHLLHCYSQKFVSKQIYRLVL
mgnify:CR=1 FL=1